MDPMFIDIHPTFLRSLLASIEVAPPEDMDPDDRDIYRAVSRVLGLLTDQTTDATLGALWARAVSEQSRAETKGDEE